ncbi:MAG: hypothetical protein R3C10_16840 [Pirellulales bacterium]|nr:flagellar export chaperone FlgN [Planctomycetales bacterium]
MDTSQTDQLAERIAAKHECLRQLVELGRAQFELIEANDLARLLRLLAAKQVLIGRLEAVSKSLEPFRGQDPEARVWRTAELRECAARQLRECDEFFALVSQQEQQSEARLRTKRDDAGSRLRTIHSADHTRTAYGTSESRSRHELDLASSE